MTSPNSNPSKSPVSNSLLVPLCIYSMSQHTLLSTAELIVLTELDTDQVVAQHKITTALRQHENVMHKVHARARRYQKS
jgi:hypothetical protein